MDSGSAKIFVRRGHNACIEQAKITAKDPEFRGGFGWSVAISGNTAIVGAPNRSGNNGGIYIVDGKLAIIGAPGDDDAGNNAGSAYIFKRDADGSKEQAKLIAKDVKGGSGFGNSVFIRRNLAIIGAHRHSHSGTRFAGAAYIFEHEADTWTQRANLIPEDPTGGQRFGDDVSIDGDTAIVAAPLDSGISSQSGAAYVFANIGKAWQQQTKLVAEDTEELDRFATNVASSGTDAFIGHMYDDDRAMNSGAVYSFRRIDGNWMQNKKIIPGAGKKIVAEADFKNLEFGSAIAVSQDLVVVSGHFNAHAKSTGTAAYIFDREKDFDAPYRAERSGLAVKTLRRIKSTSLLQNVPNPFNPETWIPLYLGTGGEVNVSIYNIADCWYVIKSRPKGCRHLCD